MKRQTLFCIALTVLFAALGVIVNAQTPREQLPQLVEQLQKTPADDALRERVITLAKTLDPPPAVPNEALRREGRGKFAFKSAKTNDDYLAAAKEYEEAVRIAPWIHGYYSDLCTIYEKAEDFASAKRNCELSLIGVTNQSEINETKQRIAGLEFGIEKANSPEAREAKEKEAAEARAAKAKGSLAGNWKVFVNGKPQTAGTETGNGGTWAADFHYRFEVRGNDVTIYYITDADPDLPSPKWCRRNGGSWACKGDEDLFAKVMVNSNVIKGTCLFNDYNTELSGTLGESEIRWVWKGANQKGEITTVNNERLRKVD
jgi:hypothetical protein